jgi:tetratricopeptide (TPR) repeat protein
MGEPKVLVFYGVGGIGKTTLRRELTRLIESETGIITAALDFEVPNYRDHETALYVLRESLGGRYKLPFRTFDVAHGVYWNRIRPQTPIERQVTLFSLPDESSLAAELISMFSNISVIGLIPDIAMALAKGGKLLNDWWRLRGEHELHDLPELEPPQIAERLPMFMAADLKDFLARRNMRAVLFLDTYEALWETERGEGTLLARDEWVREFVAQLPEVLWVICGREKLRWEEVDAEWGSRLEQHLIGGLAPTDAQRFLDSCGVADPVVQQAIVTASKGMPYYLDLAVDTFVEITEGPKRAPQPEDFEHTPDGVFRRFLRNLTQPEIETLKVLAVPRFWTYELFEQFVTRFQTGYPLTAFEDLCRFSFISQEPDSDRWTMHELMRRSLAEHGSPTLAKRVHEGIFRYYSSQLEGLEVKQVADRHRLALAEAFYHGGFALEPVALFNWFVAAKIVFFGAAQYGLLLPLHIELVARLQRALGPEAVEVAKAIHHLACVDQGLANYAEAERLYLQVIEIKQKALGPDDTTLAGTLHNLAGVYEAQNRYADAERICRRALAIREKTVGPNDVLFASSLDGLALLLERTGRFDEAEATYLRALAIKEKAVGPEDRELCWSLVNLAKLYQERGRLADAERLFARTRSIHEKTLGPEHPFVAENLVNLAKLYITQTRYNDAEPLLRRALGIWEKAVGPEHPSTKETRQMIEKLPGAPPASEPMHRSPEESSNDPSLFH